MKRKLLLLATIIMLLSGSCAWAQKDVTSTYIKNADLSTLDGWTQTNFSNPIKGNNTVGYAAESYAGWGSLEKTAYSLKQTITLPKGEYTLVNYSFFRQGEAYNTDNTKSLAVLKAGEKNVAIKTLGSIEAAGYANSHGEGANCLDSKMYRNTLDFTIDTDGTEIEIGIEGTFDQMRSWCIVGMFELIDKNSEATMDVPLDVTGYITNPGFEYRNMTGWTLSGDGALGTQTNNQSFKKGLVYAEKWQASGALTERSMQQAISGLPAGYYKLTANLGGDGTYLSLNGKTVNWSGDNDYTTGYVLGENEDLIIKAGKTAEGTANWIHFDDFRLYFCGDVNAALEAQISKLSSYEIKMPLGKYNELKTAVTAYDKDYSDIDELLQAISAIETLYADADEFIKAFNVLYSSAKELIALCEKYSENSTPNSEDIKNTFDGNIATAKTDVESAQTVETLTNAIAALESARQTYVQNAYPTNDVTFDLTFKIVNAQVTSKDGWTTGRIHSGEQYTGAPDDTYLDNWNAEANNIKQEVVLPKGVYQLKAATRAGSDVTVGNIYILDQATENNFSTDIHKVGNSGNTLGYGWDWTVVDNIILEGESNTVTVGFYSETSGGKWAGADNFTLTLVSKEPDFAYTLVTGKMESAVATAQTAAETAFKNNKTVENYNALLAAIDDAQASVDAYTSAAKYFPKMKAVLDNTNVYTQEAYNAKYGTWLAAYNENTLETAIAATLTENSAYSTGWHATNNIDDILLSTWTVGGEAAYEYDKALYINTWSIEGDSDGSNMSAPFFEYWIGDGEKLADNELVSTLPVEDGLYKFTALVRVVNKKTDEGNAGYDGISFQVNDGDVVPFTTGSEVIMDGKTVGIAATVEAQGLVKDGNLVIKAIVSGTNASWLSMKDFKYTKVRDLTEEEKAVVPTEITLDKTEVALNTETKTATLVPTFSPDNANTTVTWASSDATVATVDANGVVTALSSGTTIITVASTLNPDVKATATVTVTFPETAMPTSTYVNDGPKRSITTVTGENLIKNGTFEYPNGFYGWTNGAGGNIDATNFAIVDGALNAKNSNGIAGVGSIGTAWTIEAGKTYVFGYKVKGTPTNDKSKFMVVSLTNTPEVTDSDGPVKISDDNTPVTTEWSEVKYVFTNTEGYAYLQFRARWLGNSVHFDDFYLAEVTTTEEGNVDYATAAIPTANIGDGAFQYSQTAIDAANALVQGTATVEEVQNAYDDLQVLNAPADNTRYAFNFNCEGHSANGNAITLIEGGRPDQGNCGLKYLAPQNVNYAQSFVLTKSDAGVNYYNISTTLSTGTTMYLTTATLGYGANNYHSGLRWTDDATKALNVEIRSASEGQYYLWNTMQNAAIAHNGNSNNDAFTNNSATFSIVVAQPAEVTLNSDGGYYTLMLPFAAELPTGMKAYTCAEVEGNVLTLTEATSFAPNTPYIVVEGAGNYTFSGYGLATAASYTEGLLTGAYAQTDVPAGSYVLAVKPGETDAKFYVVGDAGAKLPAYRAYLTVANSEVKAFTIGRGDATGISAIEALQNGDAEIYTINGTRVNTLQKGVNIIKMSNGKTQKVLVK